MQLLTKESEKEFIRSVLQSKFKSVQDESEEMLQIKC